MRGKECYFLFFGNGKINKDKSAKEPGAILFNKVSTDRFHSLYFINKCKIKVTSRESFIKEISYTLPQNGFNNNILNLKKEEQQVLYEYLMNLLKQTN